MRRYAEIYRSFVIGFHERDDMRRPEFVGNRIAVRVDQLATQPELGWYFDGRRFFAPDATQPRNVNLDPPPPSDRVLLEETREIVQQILAKLRQAPIVG